VRNQRPTQHRTHSRAQVTADDEHTMDMLSQLDDGSINFLQECEAKAHDNDDVRHYDSGDEIEAREAQGSLMAELKQDQVCADSCSSLRWRRW
jgi:hypothetical protein